LKIKCARNVQLFVVSSVVIVLFISASFLKLSANPISNQSDIKLKKVIVLGFDGLDPQILMDLVHEGKLPNFKMLMETGDFHTLDTSIPPLSPVAWANFITGMNSGGHGIFDFIHRDPKTMLPFLSTSKVQPANTSIRIRDFVIPLSSERIKLLREGKPFWQTLEEHGIPTTIIRVPAKDSTRPPVRLSADLEIEFL